MVDILNSDNGHQHFGAWWDFRAANGKATLGPSEITAPRDIRVHFAGGVEKDYLGSSPILSLRLRPLIESPLRNKPAAVIGASTGMFGAVWAQAELRKVLTAIGANVVDRELPVPMADEIVRDREKLESSGTHSLIVGILAELLEQAQPAKVAA